MILSNGAAVLEALTSEVLAEPYFIGETAFSNSQGTCTCNQLHLLAAIALSLYRLKQS